MSKKTNTTVFMNLTNDDCVVKINGRTLEVTAVIAAALSSDELLQKIFRAAINTVDRVKNAETNN